MTLDSQVGIGVYSTRHEGIGGRIRGSPEDFEVTEVLSGAAQRAVSAGGDYAVYVLKKRGIDTNHALSDLRRRTGARLKALGLKDASAVTRQFVCSTRRGAEIKDYSSAKYSVELAGRARRPLSKGDMVANRFAVRIRDSGDISSFAEYDRILNFYGYQRFGSKRPITHLVGRAVVRGDFEGAVDLLTAGAGPEPDYARRLAEMPRWMDVERTVLERMAGCGDALQSLRAAPVSMRRFYVQAYQSYIFNRTLSLAYSGGEDLFSVHEGDVSFDPGGRIGRHPAGTGGRLAVPTVGYAYYKKTRFDAYVSQVLEEEEVSPGDFVIKGMDEASGEGGFRQAAAECTDWAVRGDVVEFTLSRGSFATMVLREMIKPADPAAAGF